MYENKRQRPRTREAAVPRHPPAGTGVRPHGSEHDSGGRPADGSTLAGAIPGTGGRRHSIQAASGPASQARHPATRAFGADASERPLGARILDRPMDGWAGVSARSQAFWDFLPPLPHPPRASRHGVEPAKTRAKGLRAQRVLRRPLDTPTLDLFKKKPGRKRPISSSWMRAGFSWCPWSEEPGRLSHRLPSSGMPDDGRRYRRLPPLRFLLSDIDSACFSGCTPKRTSASRKSYPSCAISSAMFGSASSSSGTMADPIGHGTCGISSDDTRASGSNGSPAMRPISTPKSMSGATSSSTDYPTTGSPTSSSFIGASDEKLIAWPDDRICCAPSSLRLNFQSDYVKRL
jgi:hypothetical protein